MAILNVFNVLFVFERKTISAGPSLFPTVIHYSQHLNESILQIFCGSNITDLPNSTENTKVCTIYKLSVFKFNTQDFLKHAY